MSSEIVPPLGRSEYPPPSEETREFEPNDMVMTLDGSTYRVQNRFVSSEGKTLYELVPEDSGGPPRIVDRSQIQRKVSPSIGGEPIETQKINWDLAGEEHNKEIEGFKQPQGH